MPDRPAGDDLIGGAPAGGNLFAGVEAPARGERFESLLRQPGVHIERIVSSGSVPPIRYEPDHHEWIALLAGAATIELAGARHRLGSGDFLFLPAGVPHVVSEIAEGTLWLAVHIERRTL